ncbi:MAG: hypothetical protein Q4F55_01960 [Bacillota bacterium]|nr:hypothetical protein [Bacillota bacterium]
MFYVTVNPVVFYALHFACVALEYKFDWWMTLAAICLCAVLALVYVITFTGRTKNKWFCLLVFLAPISLYWLDPNLTLLVTNLVNYKLAALLISDACIYVSVICMILSAKRLPDYKEGDPYRLRYGDRADGRLVHNLPPITKVAPYIMVERNDANNIIRDRVEVSNLQHYVHEKRKEGYKHFGIMHVFMAAYVRCCNDYPAINRFLSGQKIYHRYTIDINLIVKKDMTVDSPDTAVKLHCEPTDTPVEVYEKLDKLVQAVKQPELNSGFDGVAKIVDYIPGIVKKFGIWFIKMLDYFGLVPPELLEISCFHGTIFFTSMGSLGIPPIYHHLYNFGNISCFFAFGHKYTENELKLDGTVVQKKYIDFSVNTDERICDGFYYAQVLKRIKSYLLHPERLDEKPEPQEDIY